MKQTITGCLLSDIATVSTRRKTDEGYLDVDATISRSGIYEYSAGELGLQDVDAAQMVRVLRTDAEVFNEQSIGSFAKKPVTDGHPPTLVDSDNNRFYNVGISDRTVRDGDTVKTKLLITDSDAVSKVEGGTVELSCGYRADIIMGSGVDEKFGPFDAVQKNIRGNHIAITERGRAGSDCKIADKKTFNDNKGANTMLTLMFDSIQIDVTPQGKQAIEKLQRQLSDSLIVVADSKKSHEAIVIKMTTDHKSDIDKLQGELDAAKKSILDDKQVQALVVARAAIVDAAAKFKIKDFKPDGLSNAEIKKAVVKAKFADTDLKDKSEDYIDGMFSMLTKSFSKGSDNLDHIDDFVEDADDDDIVETARKKAMKDSQGAYKDEEEK